MSHDLVSIAIEGGVVTKPTLKHTGGGKMLCKFGVVCIPKWVSPENYKTDNMYFTVTALGKMGETVYHILKPGLPVRVEGELHEGIYRDPLSDEPKIGRVIFAARIKAFTYWRKRPVSGKTKELQDNVDRMTIPEIDLDDLPF